MIAFSGNPLNRASEKRGDAVWLAAARANGRARILPLWRLRPLIVTPPPDGNASELFFLTGALAASLGPTDALEVFLGRDGDTPYFVRDISALADPLAGPLAGQGDFCDARSAAGRLNGPHIAILGQAKALVDWHARHGFCARCGSPTVLADAGYRRLCPSCKAEHFPRTDPAVIMLVTAGERCLLARNKRFAGGHFSTLAGFVEPGETIEEAVAREVFEEVGLRVGGVRYFASQPWPFPSSLMIGCFASSLTEEIAIDGDEIMAARWFDRETVRRLLNGQSTEVSIPRRDAIAHHLIRAWAEED